jgi:multiple sugar transport system permease protein
MAELAESIHTAKQHRTTSLFDTAVLWKVALYALLLVLSISFLLPLIWMVSTSLKDTAQTYRVPPIWLPWPMRPQNYPEALTAQPFAQFFANSFRFGLFSAVGAVLSCSVVAYGFSRMQWWGRNVLFFVCLCTLMIPFQVIMIPLYLIFRNLHWLNSYKPLIVPAFFGNGYFIFLLRQFFMSIPGELSDAARIDGASELTIFFRIIMPLARAGLAVVALFQFMGAWNDYLGPLIYLNQVSLFPIALGLQRFLSQFQERLVWPYLMAASTVTVLPIVVLFFFTQRTFVEGIAIGGVKG